jgi:hypothetical protein
MHPKPGLVFILYYEHLVFKYNCRDYGPLSLLKQGRLLITETAHACVGTNVSRNSQHETTSIINYIIACTSMCLQVCGPSLPTQKGKMLKGGQRSSKDAAFAVPGVLAC